VPEAPTTFDEPALRRIIDTMGERLEGEWNRAAGARSPAPVHQSPVR
jgi:hypothetical protein